MAIRLGCRCGQQIITDDATAGQTVRCPACNLLLRVPSIQPMSPPPPESPPAAPAPGGFFEGYPAAPPVYPSAATPQPSYPTADPGLPAPHEHVQVGLSPPSVLPAPRPVENDQPILEDEYADEDEAERERRKKEKRRARFKQLKVTALGLTLIQWSILSLLAALALMILMFALTFIAYQVLVFSYLSGEGVPPAFTPGPLTILLYLIFTLLFAHGILYIAGSILCCWVPPRSGARIFIILSVALIGTAFALMLFTFVLFVGSTIAGTGPIAALSGLLARILLLLAPLLGVAGFVLFMLFIRALAFYVHERSTGNETISILFTWGGLLLALLPTVFVGVGLIFIIPFVGPIIGSWIATAMLGTWFGFWVKQWIRLLNIVAAVRQVLSYEFGV